MASGTNVRWKLQSQNVGNETHVHFVGPDVAFDESDTEVVEQQLMGLVEEAGRTRLVLDFSNVSYLTSSTLSLLLRLQKKLHAAGGMLALSQVRPLIYEVFTVTSLHRVFEFRQQPLEACPS